MTDMDQANESQANILCKSCGLCCDGHLFIWAKLRSAEMDSAKALGLNVFRSDPRQRGFSQPCPLWNGQCTIYDAPHYPHFCRHYKCKLLKEMLDGNKSLPEALTIVRQAKEMICEVEALLPVSSTVNFRERLVEQLEGPEASVDPDFRRKAKALLNLFKKVFGIKDVVDQPDEE